MSLSTTSNTRAVAKAAHDAIDHLSDNVGDQADAAPGLLSAANKQLKQIALKSASVAKGMSDAAKAKTQVMAEQTSEQIRKEPLKAVLIAAAAGAALTAAAAIAYKRRQAAK